ncbi:MAG TPA: hypothetical protein VNR00_13520 [Opitutus sp.]|nr:hypothetical protein [Opitutus sp.]
MRFMPLRAWCGLLTLAITGAVLRAETPSHGFLLRLFRETDGIRVQYSPGDEAYVDELVLQVAKLAPEQPAAASSALTMANLAERKAEFLRLISASLGLKEPTAKMTESYDNFVGIFGAMGEMDGMRPRRFALWRRAELLARLQAGETIPHFKLSGGNELHYEIGFTFEGKDGELRAGAGERFRQAMEEMEYPIPIGEAGGTPVADIGAGLKQVQEIANYLKGLSGVQRMSAFLVFHEVAEVGIVSHYIKSKDRRWFCDGVANYVAWRTLVNTVGRDEAARYYDLDAELQKYSGQAANVDLERWPTVEDLPGSNYREDLNTANYAFATKAIADISAKHGDDVLPRLFKRIGRTSREKTSIQTVYQAFRKVAGEDMRRYLPRPANAASAPRSTRGR